MALFDDINQISKGFSPSFANLVHLEHLEISGFWEESNLIEAQVPSKELRRLKALALRRYLP